ncbi:hypothetical protein ACFVS2_20640 [Brevibacillus sp. NPDC058079]|uniref:hypothetical protein n=1 Tax=Brevibacillus sp. NPDC058079 TaxID=3346330 RepID=UPI0036E61B21
MKLLFLTPSELTQALKEIIKQPDQTQLSCEIGYSEELDTDIVSVTTNKYKEDIPIRNFVPQLNDRYNVNILSYDVYEVGDFGEGFAFAIS